MFSGRNKTLNNKNPYDFDKMYLAEQKSSLRNNFSKIGFSLLLSIVILYLISYGIVIGTAVGIKNPQNSFALSNMVSAMASILAFIPAGFFCCTISKEKISSVISFSRAKKEGLAFILLASFAFFLLSNYLTNLFLGNMDLIGIPVNQSSSGFEKSWLNLSVYILSVAVVPALTEEFLFRGVLLGILRKYGESFAVVTSALLFGLMHHNFVQLPFAFVGGLVFGYITIYTGSIVPAMIVHFANNLFSCIFSALPKYIGNAYSEIIYGTVVVAALLLGIYSVYRLSKSDEKLLRFSKRTSTPYSGLIQTEKEKYRYFFQSFGIIAFTVLLLAISVSDSFLS